MVEVKSPKSIAEAFSQLPLPIKGHFGDLSKLLTTEEKSKYLELYPRALERENRLLTEYAGKLKPPGWQTTHPQNHDADNFRYIVHTIVNTNDNDYVASLNGATEKRDRTRVWTSLEGFLKRELISTSLVDEVHRGTYYQREFIFHGFVFSVPEVNIIAVARGDMLKPSFDFANGEQLHNRQEIEKHSGVKAGIELRQNTTAQSFLDKGVNPNYNEVVIDGVGPTGEQIRVEGVFMIVDPVLGIPLYELYSRLSKNPQDIYRRLVSPVFSPALGDEVRWDVLRMRKRFQEATDLAKLLKVPHVPIPTALS